MLIFIAMLILSMISLSIDPTYSLNRYLSIVLICSARTIESLGKDFELLMWICVGRWFFLAVDSGSTTIVGLCLLLRIFNNSALDEVGGDIIGRIYEYFLNKFAKNIASDDGVFFTPKSLVKMIVNIIEPTSGVLLDIKTPGLIQFNYSSADFVAWGVSWRLRGKLWKSGVARLFL